MDKSFVQRAREQTGYTPPQGNFPAAPREPLDSVMAMPNSEKLSGTEKWLYQKLPGFSEKTWVKALQSFTEGPAGKVLQVLDVGAEGIERTLGVLAQYTDRNPEEDFNLKDAWAAGSLFWDTVRLPRVQWGKDGFPMGIQIDTDLPGTFALTEARKMLGQGKTMDEVRDAYYKNLGALALRSQLNDTIGHIAVDPLNFLLGAAKPIERLHAIRNLALTGKVSVEYVQTLEQAAKAAGNLEDATKYAEFIAKVEKEGKAMSKFDKFAIALTGGTPYTQDVSKLSKTQKWLSKLNPLALTPQARASEMLDMVAANVGEYLIRPNWGADPEEFVRSMSKIAKGSIGEQFGHMAATVQGRTVQAFVSQAEASARVALSEWNAFAKERTTLNYLSNLLGGNEIALKKLAAASPETFFEKIVETATKMGDDVLLKEIQSGNLTVDTVKSFGNVEDYALLPEAFYAKTLVDIQDMAMKQAILQFGVTEKGLITKWSDALKAWESIPFIKANPANMVRNVVNNEITLIGRGLFGTMSGSAIENFWKGKWMPPQFMRSFGFGADELKAAEGMGFDIVDKATQRLTDALTGKMTLADELKIKAGKTSLGPLNKISEYSQKAEQMASRRASTVGWMEFHQKYWNPNTGFTSVSKHLDPAVMDKLEEVAPGLANLLDDIAQESGADSTKFQKLMEMNIEKNATTVVKAAEDRLGYKFDDIVSPEVMTIIKEGLPEAMEKGTVNKFLDGVRTQMEQHVDDMFNRHVENLPGIVAAQVQAGGPMQYHRIFGKSMDEFWGGNLEHSMRMSTLNEAMDYAKASGDYTKAGKLWEKVLSDGENHFNRVWKKFDAYQEGLKAGAKNAGIPYPEEVTNAFKQMKDGWKNFFDFRNNEYKKFFAERLEGKQHTKQLEQIQATLDSMYAKLADGEDDAFRHIDDLMAASLDKSQRSMYMEFRDTVSNLRLEDRKATREFFKNIRQLPKDEIRDAYTKYWQDKMARIEKIRHVEARGSAAIQGDLESAKLFQGQPAQPVAEPKNVVELANNYGIPTATKSGARNDKRVLSTINKYLPEGTEKFKKLDEVPLDVAKQAFDLRATQKAGETTAAATRAFIPDAEKIFKDPMPIETGLSELNYGRSYATMDAIAEEAIASSAKQPRLLKDLPEDIQKSVKKWMTQVDEEMSGFRSAGVQYAAFRRDSALLNYQRRTNFDNLVGHMAPFAFWTTHSVANWAIYSIDRPAMLANYFRTRKFFETAGLPEQNVPSRLRGHIRVQLPFTPDWMGDTFVNPLRFMLPFDGFMQPWENAQNSKFRTENKAQETLNTMLQNGEIDQQQYEDAMQNQTGQAWDMAMARAQEGGDNYDAMDFVSMTMTPHAPLMWAYNAATGQKNEIGPFTPMSKTIKNFATMAGVEDWSNSPYNVEGRLRKMMGLPAYDKWDDYRVGREISNMAADGVYSMDAIRDAMEVAALVESGQMTSEEAAKNNKVYKEAIYKANQEMAGGWVGTITSMLGIPVKAYPTGEQKQRELGEQFAQAYEKYDQGDIQALTDFFDEHPEYESRLALFKKPEERLKNFMVDNVWQRWNDLPKVNQDEIKEQLGDNFANNFINKETRNYDAVTPLQLQMWLKLIGGKQVGRLDASTDALIELNQLRLTEPETAFRVQTFYDARNTDTPNWYKLQSEYYSLPESKRRDFSKKNPELKAYWDFRRKWMEKNPDLVRFLTDDQKQLAKYEKMKRQPQVSVPTANEIRQNLSQPMQELMADGQSLPPEMNQYLDALAAQYGLSRQQMMQILTGKAQ